MYSKKHKFLYVHNPKCAGTFVKHFLLSNIDEEYKDNQNQSYYDDRYKVTCERPAEPILKEIGEDVKDYFKFSIVRNPYDRAVSMFCFIGGWKYEQLMRDNPNSSLINKIKVFRDFYLNKDFDGFCVSAFKDGLIKDFHYGYYCNLWDRLTKDNKFLVDKIYKVEFIDTCLSDVSKKLNFKNTNAFYDWRVNSSKSHALFDSYRDYYSNDSKEIISNHFKKDIEEFVYEF